MDATTATGEWAAIEGVYLVASHDLEFNKARMTRKRQLLATLAGKKLQLGQGERQVTLGLSSVAANYQPEWAVGLELGAFRLTLGINQEFIRAVVPGVPIPSLGALQPNLALAVVQVALSPLLSHLGGSLPTLVWMGPTEFKAEDTIHLLWSEKETINHVFSVSCDEEVGQVFEQWIGSFPDRSNYKPGRSCAKIELGSTLVAPEELRRMVSGDVLLMEQGFFDDPVVKISFDNGAQYRGRLESGQVEVLEPWGEAYRPAPLNMVRVRFLLPGDELDLIEALTLSPGTLLAAADPYRSQVELSLKEELLASGSIVRFNNLIGVQVEESYQTKD